MSTSSRIRGVHERLVTDVNGYGFVETALDRAVVAVGGIVREDEPKPAPTDRGWIQFERGSVWD